ncbi:MAG: DNA polymerase III subunit delta [Deltaproteobacteria bacterium]|nr:MAG: DNA polymerase III subunit delta [Deltaproteobacteria bacterium]
MSHPILERHLKKQTLRPVYLFYGEEEFLLRRALERLQTGLRADDQQQSEKHILEAEDTSLAEVLSQARVPSLWGTRQLIVLYNADRYKAAELKPLGSYLDAPTPQTCLVLVAPGLKFKEVERHPYWRRLQEQEAALGFFRLKEAALPRWLEQEARRQGKVLPPAAAQRLIETVGDNLLELAQELEKLVLYMGAEKTITAPLVSQLTCASRSFTIFALVDALGQRRPEQALQILKRLLELGEPPLKILVMLARQLRLLLRLQDYQDAATPVEEQARRLGLPRGIVLKLQRQAAHFRVAELRSHLFNLHRADQGLKTSPLPPRLWLEKVILELCPPVPFRNQRLGN